MKKSMFDHLFQTNLVALNVNCMVITVMLVGLRFHTTKCVSEGHAVEQCTSLVEKCRNCGETHSTFSRGCPTWKLEKEICTVKATEGICYGEARKRVKVAQAAPASNV